MATLNKLGEPWNFSQMADALRDAHDSLMASNPVVWSGPRTTWCEIMAGSPGVPGELSPDSLAYHAERGRDAVDVLIMAAIQLGMEQGARVVRKQLQSSGQPGVGSRFELDWKEGKLNDGASVRSRNHGQLSARGVWPQPRQANTGMVGQRGAT